MSKAWFKTEDVSSPTHTFNHFIFSSSYSLNLCIYFPFSWFLIPPISCHLFNSFSSHSSSWNEKKNWVHIHCEFFGCPSSSLMSHHFSFPYTDHWQVTLAGRLLDSLTLPGKGGSAALCAQTASLGRGIRYLGTLNTPGGGLVTMLCG